MKHLKSKDEVNISNYAPVLTKDCEGACDRKVIVTKTGPIIICDGCNRIVMDNRK
jgi:hypothetical protein